MPKHKRAAKNSKNKRGQEQFKRPLEIITSDFQVYGIITKVLGCSYFTVQCYDGESRRCKVRTKRMRLKLEDIVIVSLRDFGNNHDIIHVYKDYEVVKLRQIGELPNQETSNDDTLIDFKAEDDFDFNMI